MKTKKRKFLPIWRHFLQVFLRRDDGFWAKVAGDFFSFLRLVILRLLINFSSSVRRLFSGLRRVMLALVLIKRSGIRLMMSRRHTWLVEKLNLGVPVGIVIVFVLFAPQVESFSSEWQLIRKLERGEVLASGCGNVLMQNNTVDTITQTREQRIEIVDYTVLPGDTLFDIGRKFNVTVDSLAYINDLPNENYLSPGEVIKIPPVTGVIHMVKSGETVSTIASQWGVSAQSVVDANWLDDPYVLAVGQELVIPKSKMPSRVSTVSELASSSTTTSGGTSPSGLQLVSVSASGAGNISIPCQGQITQYFSWYHPAIDVAARCGTPVTASDTGQITFAGWWAGGGGYTVVIDHGNGYVTKYAHLKGFARTSGYVAKDEVIGYMGATGRAYGCHTHFIVLRNGRAVDPLSLIR